MTNNQKQRPRLRPGQVLIRIGFVVCIIGVALTVFSQIWGTTH